MFLPVERGTDGDIWVAGASSHVRRTETEPLVSGGVVDTVLRMWSSKPANDPQVFYFGESQRIPLRFGFEDKQYRRLVVVGSMGSGKSEIGAEWVIRQAQRLRNCTIGVFAPVSSRIQIVYKKIRKRLRPEWILDIRTSIGEVQLVNGVTLKFASLKEYSKDVGSPIAGLDLAAALIDEEQDCTDEAIAEVESRGRSAPGGYFPLFSTCTLKDASAWRERKRSYEERADTLVYRMLILDNPFVSKEYIEGLKLVFTPRRYRMRVLALDAMPELATYYNFDRERHIRRRPLVGPPDVTEEICGFPFLIGHDPGTIFDVSVILKCFRMPKEPLPWWWIVGEVTTEQQTKDQHVAAVVAHLRKVWQGWLRQCLVVADPYTDTGSGEKRPDVSVYKTWVNEGVGKIRPAAYTKRTRGPLTPGVVPKEPRFEMVNLLFGTESGTARLYVDTDDAGKPVAPKTLESLEMSERDEAGKAEAQRKTKSDLSHWTAALGYGLWPFEKIRLQPADERKQQHGNP